MLDRDDEYEVEKAVALMVDSLRQENRKGKPVIMHSLRVGLYLYGLDYSKETVIAGILHDTLEASNLKPIEIEKPFGREVTALVEANTNDESIQDKTGRYHDTFRRCMERGEDALSIKAADLLDNLIHSYRDEKDPEKRQKDLEKVRYFLDLTSERLKNSEAWTNLEYEYSSST